MPYETIGGGQNYGAEVENGNVPLVDWSQVVNEAMVAMPKFSEEEIEAEGAAFDSMGELAAAEGGEMAQAEYGDESAEGDAVEIEAAEDEADEGGEDAAEAKAERAEDREGKIKRIFEKVRGRLGFRKVVAKVKKKLAQAVVGAVAWAENALKEDEEGEAAETEKVTEAEDEAEAETEDAAEVEDAAEAEDAVEAAEAEDVAEAETPETEKAPEMERGEKLRQLGLVKAEVERRVRTATDNEAQMRWIIVAKEIDDKIIQLRVDEERERIAAENAFQPYEAVDFAGKFGIEKLKTDGVIPQDMEPTLEEMRALEKDVDGKIFAAVRDGDEIAENHYRSQMEYIQMAARGLAQEQAKAETKTEMVEEVETEKAA